MSIKVPTFEELNFQQKDFYEKALKNKDVIIIGGPGTGKSVMAIHLFNALSSNKQMITFNKNLVDFLEKSVETINDIETNSIRTVSSYALSLLRVLNSREFKFTDNKYNVEELNDDMRKKLDEGNLEQKTEVLIIDESQDVNLVFHEFFKQTANKKIIFLDDKQKITSNAVTVRDIKNKLYPNVSPMELTINYRNTKQIYNLNKHLFSTSDLQTCQRDGNKPELINFNSEDDMIKNIINIIENNPFKSILVLMPYTNAGEGLSTVRNRQVENFSSLEKTLKASNFKERVSSAFGEKSDLEFSKNCVHLLSTNTNKGLEYDIVIMPYLNDDFYNHDNFESNEGRVFVAFTRTRNDLKLLYHGSDNNSYYIKKIKEQPNLAKIRDDL